ncbi:MAG: hypothetical protein KC464_07130, partial [Myxococcales bacterium]|nr:hypothetical protein [Myxococcales bacterium]
MPQLDYLHFRVRERWPSAVRRDDQLVIAPVAIDLFPAPGVIASAPMPVLEGVSLRVRPDAAVGNYTTLHPAFDRGFRVDADDHAVARLLLDEATQIELAAGHDAAQTVVVANRRVDVLGTPRHDEDVVAALRAVVALAHRPYQVVRDLRTLLRRWDAVPSHEQWDVATFRMALTLPTPSIHFEWRQRALDGTPAPRLTTRVVAERREPLGAFQVLDRARVPATGPSRGVPLDVPGVADGRYELLADRATHVHDDLAPLLPLLGEAL